MIFNPLATVFNNRRMDPMPSEDEDRREFLKTCGKFAAVTPPAMTMLLSTSLTSNAIARSGGGGSHGHEHHHHHHHDRD
jgi:hypothetical protein